MCASMRDNTVDDCHSRVSIALRESEDYRQKITGIFFVAAGFWAAALAGLWWFSMSTPWLIILGAAAIILSTGALIAAASQRLYVQNAFTEMTVAHLESEIKRLHERLSGLEVDVGKSIGENRAYRL